MGLGSYGLWDPDEGRHAAIARAVYGATSWHGWLVPTHNFTPYHDKPILYYWLASLAFTLTGAGELGARLVPALAALLTLGTLIAWTATVFDPRTARRAAIVLLTSGGFLGLARYGDLNMLLTCWITLGVVTAERWTAAPHRRGLLVVAASAAGLGMLTKGLVAPLFVAGIPLAHAWMAGRALPRPRALALAAVVFLLVAGPWYVAVAAVDPGYLREFFLVHHLARFASHGARFHDAPWWYYGPALAAVFFPWSVLLPASLATMRPWREDGIRFCLWWAAAVIGFFSCSEGKLATYILPALPPLAVVTARALDALPAAPRMPRRLAAGGLAVLVLVLLGVTPLAAHVESRSWSLMLPAVRPYALVLPATALGLLACWWRWGLPAAIAAVAPCVLAGALLFYTRVAPAVSRVASEEPIAEMIATRIDAPIVSYDVTPASLQFYVERPVVRLSRPRRLASFLAEHPFAWIVTSPRHLDEIRRVAAVYPWVTTGRHVLYATLPADTFAAADKGRAAN